MEKINNKQIGYWIMTTKSRIYILYTITLGLVLAMSLITSSLMNQRASAVAGTCGPDADGGLICYCQGGTVTQPFPCNNCKEGEIFQGEIETGRCVPIHCPDGTILKGNECKSITGGSINNSGNNHATQSATNNGDNKGSGHGHGKQIIHLSNHLKQHSDLKEKSASQ
jgi:hypothetical protein